MAIIPVAYLATTEELTLIANEFKEEAIIKLTQNGSNVTGKLAASIKVQPARVEPTRLVIPVTMLKYGEYVDDGAERGRGRRPPVQDIVQWIKLKRISVPKQFKKVALNITQIVLTEHPQMGIFLSNIFKITLK